MLNTHRKYSGFLNFLFFLCTVFISGPGLDRCLAYNRETAVVRAVHKVSTAVVNISSEYEVRFRPGIGLNPFFESFFKDFFDHQPETRYKKNSLGSGVIIDGGRGYILTNAHVIERSGKITITLKDKREFKASIAGADPESDLAVLKVSSKTPLPSIKMGNSSDLMIGETVIAIGNPFGFSNTVTTGVISALNRSIRTEAAIYHNFIQIDASINPGNSGGPLLNINGELIGINTAIYAKAQGIGFAIPITKAKRIISDLIKFGEVIPAWTGITVQDINENVAGYLKISASGVIVKDIIYNSPAAKAGIRTGDFIVLVGKAKITSGDDFYRVMRDYKVGDKIKIGFLRNRKKRSVFVSTTSFPTDLAKAFAYRVVGVRVKNDATDKNLGTTDEQAVVIYTVNPKSYLARIGVAPGDKIRQIDEMTIKTTDDFNKAIVKYHHKKSVVILLQRENQGYYITILL